MWAALLLPFLWMAIEGPLACHVGSPTFVILWVEETKKIMVESPLEGVVLLSPLLQHKAAI